MVTDEDPSSGTTLAHSGSPPPCTSQSTLSPSSCEQGCGGRPVVALQGGAGGGGCRAGAAAPSPADAGVVPAHPAASPLYP